MTHNYFKITIRNLNRQKGYALITLGGLAVGLAFFILAISYANFYLRAQHIDGVGLYKTASLKFYIVLVNALVLLLIVCINFMNLSTARYMSRIKEVGMRKVVGARRSQLIYQFMGESILLSMLALPLALAVFELIRPVFISLIGVEVPLSLWRDPKIPAILVAVTLLVGIISGSYPALFLSAFSPLHVLKKNMRTGSRGVGARKIIVTVQFTLSVILIFFALMINQQFEFFRETGSAVASAQPAVQLDAGVRSVAAAFKYISIVSIIISCIGLLGLTIFTVGTKTREIGVRKVFGASVSQIIRLLLFDFLGVVLLAFAIAAPFALYSSHKLRQWTWVQDTRIGLHVVLVAVAVTFLAALISVLFQTVRAGRANPAESLRYE